MRITGGNYRNLIIKSPKVNGVRPTSDLVREALFNIITNRIENILFLDLFAGSGAVGIEALSRGAEKCIFIDKKSQCVKIINENLQRLDIVDKAIVLKRDVISGIEDIGKKKQLFVDLIYCDPPYEDYGIVLRVMECIKANKIIKENGMLIVEHFKKNKAENNKDWSLLDNRNYGDTILSFYKIKF